MRTPALTLLLVTGSLCAACRPPAAPHPEAATAPEASTCAESTGGNEPRYMPTIGQAGKDVVWVPTSSALIERMFEMARLTTDDYLVDLGSGDGITVIMAAKRGTRALGVEYNADLVDLARRTAEAEGLSDLARFIQADIFKTDFSKATVVTLFLLPELNLRLRPTLLAMAPGTRVVSNTFDMGDWLPDEVAEVGEDCVRYCVAYHWVVPADLSGRWQTDDGPLVLRQTYQLLEGTLGSGRHARTVSEGRILGTRVRFEIGGDVHEAELVEGELRGEVNRTRPWSARRLR